MPPAFIAGVRELAAVRAIPRRVRGVVRRFGPVRGFIVAINLPRISVNTS